MVAVPDGDDDEPNFQFTVGLTERDLPEVIVYGLGVDAGQYALDELAGRLMRGERYADGETIPDLFDGDLRFQLRTAVRLKDPLGMAFRLYGEDRVAVRQLVVPDLEGRLPWESRYAIPELQPMLFNPP